MNLDRSIKNLTLFGFALLALVAVLLLFSLGVLIPGFFDELLLVGLIILAIKGISEWLNQPQRSTYKEKMKSSLYANFLTYQLDGYIGNIDEQNERFGFFCRDGIIQLDFASISHEELQKVKTSLQNQVFPKMELHLHTINKSIIFYKLLL